MASFLQVSFNDYNTTISTLERRLPRSGMTHNILKMQCASLHPPTVTTKVYAFDGTIVEEKIGSLVFIAIIQYRQVSNDFAVIVSVPETVTPEMKDAFNKLVDWNLPICFSAVDKSFSDHVTDLCSRNGQLVDVDQCQFMTMNISKAKSISIEETSESIVLKELSPEDADLVAKRWKFASKGSDKMISDTIKHTGSAGVFLGGELVSWVVIFVIGSINALYTEVEHRGKGFGALTMQKVCKVAGEKGLIPNVQVQIGNSASKNLMLKIGFQDSHIIEWINYVPL